MYLSKVSNIPTNMEFTDLGGMFLITKLLCPNPPLIQTPPPPLPSSLSKSTAHSDYTPSLTLFSVQIHRSFRLHPFPYPPLCPNPPLIQTPPTPLSSSLSESTAHSDSTPSLTLLSVQIHPSFRLHPLPCPPLWPISPQIPTTLIFI